MSHTLITHKSTVLDNVLGVQGVLAGLPTVDDAEQLERPPS